MKFNIEKDKILHFIAGYMIMVIFSLMAYMQELDNPQIYGIVATIIVGIGKESWDEYIYGGFDMCDLFATCAGGMFGLLLVVTL